MSTHNYLDKTGLGQVWEKIKNLTSRKTASIPFGEVDLTSTATAFTATIDGITELRDGVCVYLTNGVVTSASGWTLNINNLGAKPVYQSMAAASRITTTFNVAYTALFVYNSSRVEGGCWDFYYGYNSNDNTIAYQVRMNQAINEMYAALTRYKICFTRFDGTLLPCTSVSNSTGTTKALTTESFDPYGAIYYYNTTTGVAAGETPSASYMWLLYHNVDLRYGFNAGTTLVAKENVYIKCSPQDDGSVKLAGNDCIVQSLPNTDDGYVYIYLGKAYDTYRMSLDINHPIYYFKSGQIRMWTNSGDGISTVDVSFNNPSSISEAIVGTTAVGDDNLETETSYQTIYNSYSNDALIYFHYYNYCGQAFKNSDNSFSAICFESNDLDNTEGMKIIYKSDGTIVSSRFCIPLPEDDINVLNLLSGYGFVSPISDASGNVIVDADNSLILG